MPTDTKIPKRMTIQGDKKGQGKTISKARIKEDSIIQNFRKTA